VGGAAVDATFPWAEAAAASAASVVAAEYVSAPVSGFVAGVSVLPAASSHHSRSFALDAGVPVPASARVADVADSASGSACPAVADISGPVWGSQCWEQQGVRAVEAPRRGLQEAEERCSLDDRRFPDDQLVGCPGSPAEEHYSPDDPPESRRVRLEDDMALPLLWPATLPNLSIAQACP